MKKEMINKAKEETINNIKNIKSKITQKTKEISQSLPSIIENKNQLITEEDIIKILDCIYQNVINGLGKTSPAVEVFSDEYLKKDTNPEVAVKKMMKNQITKCATSGFITGFGGLITLPATIPANLSSVLYVQMRMIASSAYMAGYDLKSDQVQTLVYACLAGISIGEIVKQTGIKVGVKMATNAISKIPGKTLTKINQKVGTRFITKFGEKGIINLGKLVPGVGAIIGGSIDYVETKVIANRAYNWFFKGKYETEELTEEAKVVNNRKTSKNENQNEIYQKIKDAKEMLDNGFLTEEEFGEIKSKLIEKM